MITSVNGQEVADALTAARKPGTKTLNVGGQPVSFPVPYPSPQDWRDHWIYFLMVDRFNNPSGPPKHLPFDLDVGEFQGGTFNGVREQLDYLKDLGVGAIWLSPVLKNCQWDASTHHGYGIQNFLQVEPRFASTPAKAETELRDLVDAAHARGIYVILDIVLNHAGNLFNYEGMQDSQKWRGGGKEYDVFWRDGTGVPQGQWPEAANVPQPVPADGVAWPKELQRNDFWRRRGDVSGSPDETRGDFGSMKEIVTEYIDNATGQFPVREILIRAHQYLIARFDVDGFRIDTLKYVEPDFAHVFGSSCREFAQSIGKKNFFTFGEIWESDNEAKIAEFIGRNTERDDEPVGVDAALDFPLYQRLNNVIKYNSPPSELQQMFKRRREAHRHLLSSHGEAGKYFVTFLDNHDLDQRFYFQPAGSLNQFDDQLILALACLLALQGVPCVYYGTEQGLHGQGNRREFVREALWGKQPTAFDPQHKFYQALQAIDRVRKGEPALRYGRQYFRELAAAAGTWGHSTFPHGVIAFCRILDDREVLLVANTSATDATPTPLYVQVDADLTPVGSKLRLLYQNPSLGAGPEDVVSFAGRAATKIKLRPMEVQVFAKG